jgi:hypothetical protein
MKTRGIVLFLFWGSMIAPALAFAEPPQYGGTLPTGLKSKLDDKSSNVTWASVGFTPGPTGAWVAVGDATPSSGGPLLPSLGNWLNKLANDGTAVKSIVLAPDGGWVTIHEGGCQCDMVPASLSQFFVDVKTNNWTLTCVAFTMGPLGSWVAITDRGATKGVVEYSNVPPVMQGAIEELRQNGTPLKYVALAPNGGWVLVRDGDIRTGGNLPNDFKAAVQKIDTAKTDVKCIALVSQPDGTTPGWVIITADLPSTNAGK